MAVSRVSLDNLYTGNVNTASIYSSYYNNMNANKQSRVVSSNYQTGSTAYKQNNAHGTNNVGNTDGSVNNITDYTSAVKKRIYGKTIGEPQLSEGALKVYNDLKNKYSNNEFILVDDDQINSAQSMAASFANKDKLVVLINESKLEKMAEDSNYLNEIESKIQMANTKLPDMQAMMQNDSSVKGIGLQFGNDGTSKFFAIVDKNNKSFNEMVEKIREKRKQKKTEEEKKAKRKEEEEEWEEKLEEIKQARKESLEVLSNKDEDVFGLIERGEAKLITADTLEGLYQKVKEYHMEEYGNSIFSPREMAVGSRFDFKV